MRRPGADAARGAGFGGDGFLLASTRWGLAGGIAFAASGLRTGGVFETGAALRVVGTGAAGALASAAFETAFLGDPFFATGRAADFVATAFFGTGFFTTAFFATVVLATGLFGGAFFVAGFLAITCAALLVFAATFLPPRFAAADFAGDLADAFRAGAFAVLPPALLPAFLPALLLDTLGLISRPSSRCRLRQHDTGGRTQVINKTKLYMT